MVFIQPIYSTATHFPISKNTEVSMEQIITLKAVHMRCINASVCVSRAYMDLFESPTCTCLSCGCSNTVRLQLWIVLALRPFSLFGFNCKCLMTCTCAVKCLATTGCLAEQHTGSTWPAAAVVPLLKFSLEPFRPYMQIVSQILRVCPLLQQSGL